MKSYYHRIKHHIRKPIHKAIKQKSSPHSIAIGFAIGTFIAIFPTFFLGIVIILIIMLFYKSMNKIAAIAGLTFWNVVMMAPIYWASYNLGRLIFHSANKTTLKIEGHELIALMKIKPFSLENILALLRENLVFLKEYFIGNLILAAFFSCISYLLIKKAVIIYREAKEKRILAKKKK
jgi:uncharacterized protein